MSNIPLKNFSNPPLRVVRLSEHAKLPHRASSAAAGYDLYSAVNMSIPGYGKANIFTDIQIAVPLGTYGRIAPRSGLAINHFLSCGAGVIDPDYRGNIGVVLFNHGGDIFEVKRGDRIAQLVLEKIASPKVEEVVSLDETKRGSGGFGSTGISTWKNVNEVD